MGELEFVFHDSVPLEEERLPAARAKASRQKEAVLDYFRQRYSHNFTPIEVWAGISFTTQGDVLLTSIRRAISDLTKEGKLTKCDYSERREGGYGHPNRVWRYNVGYLPSLNKK